MPESFVMSENGARRHLKPIQHACIVASLQNWAAAAHHGTNRHHFKSDQLNTLGPITSLDRAEMAGVSRMTQRRADAVAKASPRSTVPTCWLYLPVCRRTSSPR